MKYPNRAAVPSRLSANYTAAAGTMTHIRIQMRSHTLRHSEQAWTSWRTLRISGQEWTKRPKLTLSYILHVFTSTQGSSERMQMVDLTPLCFIKFYGVLCYFKSASAHTNKHTLKLPCCLMCYVTLIKSKRPEV